MEPKHNPRNTIKKLGGRPTEWTEEVAMELAKELMEWMEASEENILFNRFLYEKKGLSHQIISELCHKWPKFSDAIKRAKDLQESKLVDGAMKMKLNTTMTIFFLKCNRGWQDKQQVDVTTGGKPIQISFDLSDGQSTDPQDPSQSPDPQVPDLE